MGQLRSDAQVKISTVSAQNPVILLFYIYNIIYIYNSLSSAYKAIELSLLIAPGKSSIQIIKNECPHWEPLGTPEVIIS